MPQDAHINTRITPTQPSRLMGAVHTKFTKLFENAQAKGHQNFFYSNAIGNGLMLLSGLFEGNIGRAATGGMNLVRNAGSGVAMEKLSHKFNKAALQPYFMAAAALTNVPQMITAATTAERVAATIIISAYSARTISDTLKYYRLKKQEQQQPDADSLSTKVTASTSKRVGLDLDHGARLIKKGVKTGLERSGDFMPMMLLGRAVSTMWDALSRGDAWAVGSSLAFQAGAAYLGAADHKMRQDIKRAVEASAPKTRVNIETEAPKTEIKTRNPGTINANALS